MEKMACAYISCWTSSSRPWDPASICLQCVALIGGMFALNNGRLAPYGGQLAQDHGLLALNSGLLAPIGVPIAVNGGNTKQHKAGSFTLLNIIY